MPLPRALCAASFFRPPPSLPTAERFSRLPGMLNSSEVKVFHPT